MMSSSTTAPGESLRLRAVRAGLGLACVFACLMLAATPAAAKLFHVYEGSFTGSDTPNGALGYVVGVAVDNSGGPSAGDVYVGGSVGSSYVYKFKENGKYAGVQLDGSETPQGSFNLINFGTYEGSHGIAVDGSDGANKGDVYVVDVEHQVVDRFSEMGHFLCQITGKTPTTTAEKEHECAGATGSQTPQNGFTPGSPFTFSAPGVAVNPVNGYVYVSDPGSTVIDEFNEKGEYVTQIVDPHITSPSTLALNASGELYVVNGGWYFNTNNVVEFDANGIFKAEIDSESADSVAVNPVSNRAYVYEYSEQQIAEYDLSGKLVATFGKEQPTVDGLVGASGSTGRIYMSGVEGGPVYMYSKPLVVPEVETGVATGTAETSAIVHGHVAPDVANGGGEVTKCEVEYGPTKSYGFTEKCSPNTPYSAAQEISANLTELNHQTVYHYRVKAEDAQGAEVGEDKTFSTAGPPTIDHEAAEALQTSVDLRAHINPWGYDTSCQAEYVTDAAFQKSGWTNAATVTCPEDLGSGFGDVTAILKVAGLARATIYHYRFLASNQVGLVGDSGGTFETYGIRKLSLEFLKTANVSFSGGLETWEAGAPETLQAGAHPYELVTTVTFSHTTEFSRCSQAFEVYGCTGEIEIVNNTAVNTKDVKVDLPPGLIGNPTSLPKCNRYLVQLSQCPSDTQVGMIEIWVDYPLGRNTEVWPLPEEHENENLSARRYIQGIYNVEPAGPHPAEFAGFIEGEAPAWIPFDVRTGSDYGVSADAIDITDVGGGISRIRTRVWGVPADPAHESERHCPEGSHGHCADTEPEVPLLSNPTSCAGPLSVTASADSWQEPGQYVTKSTEVPAFSGCGRLKFEPTVEAQPTTNVADSPSGLKMDLHVPQDVNKEGQEEPGTLTTADLKDAKIVLPAGMVLDPSSAGGLAACTEAQVGYLPGKSVEVGRPQFTPDPAKCPDASKVGSVQVDSSLVDHPLPGAVYVAQQDVNPFKSLLALYITVYDAQTGVVIKLPGKVTLDPVSGQLTTTVDEDPQLPFNDFKLDLFSGSRAALTTPLVCGSYSIGTDLTPWSAPEGQDATPSSLPFSVAGPNGAACVNSEAQAPNAPGFAAGTASPVAGSFSPFVLKLTREDGSQRFSGLNVSLPPGLIGKISGLEECSQAAIEAAQARSREGEGAAELAHPSCPAGSEVGVVHVGAGSGAPYFVTGHAYFAGPYKGAPFSLVIVTPAVAGPFDLGTVVVRAALFIDPSTAQVTVKSDPFPTILDGIPLDIRSIGVDVNRKEFTLNPTSCDVMSVTGQEASTAGQTAGLSDRFQAGGCTTLPFDPVFEASTSGTTSRREGASLVVHVASGTGQANIAKVKAELPKQLPSRLETLKGACPESVFAANPASCPAGSAVGTAVAHTPILNSPLTGPAYIVSHGGAEFPDLEVVLQGEGVTIILDGKTSIKNGITTSSFETVPDAPVSSFELTLPEGPHSILAAPGGGLCSLATRTVLVKKNVTVKVKRHGHVQKRRVTRTVKKTIAAGLVMPTMLEGQNGAVIDQKTPIEVTGCTSSTVKAKPKKQAKPKKRKTGKAGKKTAKHG